jgi:prepilin-type N-terminal cleavage/methylation domain-containing protein
MCVPRRTGFTVVELLVVIVVLGLLAGVIVPTVAAVQGQASVSSAAGDLVVVLRWAQARAQVRAEHVRVTVAADSSYAVSDQTGGEECICRQGRLGTCACSSNYPGSAVEFLPAGWPAAAGSSVPRAGSFVFAWGSATSRVVLQLTGCVRCL